MEFFDNVGSDYIPPFYSDRSHVSDSGLEPLLCSDRSHVGDSEDVEGNESLLDKNIEQNHLTISKRDQEMCTCGKRTLEKLKRFVKNVILVLQEKLLMEKRLYQ